MLIGFLIPAPARAILLIGLALILGFSGLDLRRWALEQRGYLLVHVMAARDGDEAFTRLLANRPDLASRYRPEVA